jgi:hypothetical protein
VVGSWLRLELGVGDKVTVTVEGAVLEELVAGESVTTSVVVLALGIALAEDAVEGGAELGEGVAVMVMFVGELVSCL